MSTELADRPALFVGVRGPTILTTTGNYFSFENPHESVFTIADIYKSSMGQTLLDRHRGEVVRFARALLTKADVQPKGTAEPVAWLYTLEYGTSIADRKVSVDRLRYPFGVCGSDYLRVNDDGTSYVRETPLFATKE